MSSSVPQNSPSKVHLRLLLRETFLPIVHLCDSSQVRYCICRTLVVTCQRLLENSCLLDVGRYRVHVIHRNGESLLLYACTTSTYYCTYLLQTTVREVVYYDQTVKFDPARLGGLVFANKSAYRVKMRATTTTQSESGKRPLYASRCYRLRNLSPR